MRFALHNFYKCKIVVVFHRYLLDKTIFIRIFDFKGIFLAQYPAPYLLNLFLGIAATPIAKPVLRGRLFWALSSGSGSKKGTIFCEIPKISAGILGA